MKVLQSKKILVVDDESELRNLLKEELEDNGATVLEASGGNIAFELALKNDLDAIVSDIRMPDGDGVELLKKIKDISPIKPMVLLTSGYSDWSQDEIYSFGADGIFAKPFKLDVVVKALQKLLNPPQPTNRT